MSERAEMIEWLRGELVGPSRVIGEPSIVQFTGQAFQDSTALRRGPLAWRSNAEAQPQEILYYDRESPHRKYGMGLLHPAASIAESPGADTVALESTDTVGVEPQADEIEDVGSLAAEVESEGSSGDSTDDFEVTSSDVRHPTTMGISFCAHLQEDGRLVLRIPQSKRFPWQDDGQAGFQLNGRYEPAKRRWVDENEMPREANVWRRQVAVLPDAAVYIERNEIIPGRKIEKDVPMPEGSPISLKFEAFPRAVLGRDDVWLITVVLRNSTIIVGDREPRAAVLYQTYFEVSTDRGRIERYPESQRPFGQLDDDEKSLALLYRESATWGIGHGCAAGWDAEPNGIPDSVYADVMPAVELPSMTPDIKDSNGNDIQLSMRELASLPDNGVGSAWESLDGLSEEYSAWIQRLRTEASSLTPDLATVADRHLDLCEACLNRINVGIRLLRSNATVLRSFRLANLAMLLQQIAAKQLSRRPLQWSDTVRGVVPEGALNSPWAIYEGNSEGANVGSWRAFQIAFLLMSLDGLANGNSPDREIVDLIWFPTGGGKTEAYLATVAFYMFHERFLMRTAGGMPRDGTNVLMRYTLRMLTTQQFQRAASLMCAMEFLRRNSTRHGEGGIPGRRFSLGLWIGGDGSPNKKAEARTRFNAYVRGDEKGNPLVITECPWCRAEIGVFKGPKPRNIPDAIWKSMRVKGIAVHQQEGPLLLCPDARCTFGAESHEEWLPVEVVDERIYETSPSLIIATADKLAMIAYRPQAGAIFGRRIRNGTVSQVFVPPGLIIQDELHLISGPLGTMYALYEGIFERLCSHQLGTELIKPKLVASTATIRGASDQVRSLYAREHTQLFPSPGLMMGDSFFGRYARDGSNRLRRGRLYLGLHASDYGSVLTTQVRTFASALFRAYSFAEDRRDPWWTLLTFYNSIRELGGARTLFDSDIRSRLKFLFNRENFPPQARRNLQVVEELTSRLSQVEIISMMDRLSAPYSPAPGQFPIDACLASSIIEVGVDIDRLSLMGVVGQPKTTSQYIQVTGRVGRRWDTRPGLILMIYNPSKSRDRSHFEQFHSYHRRLYERVEPTSATPFALSAIQRALPGALIAWARQQIGAPVHQQAAYEDAVATGFELLESRCQVVQLPEDQERSLREMERVRDEFERKWSMNPQQWEEFPPNPAGEYLMLWPGQFATRRQKDRGTVIPSSMRQVDGSAELTISTGYNLGNTPAT